MVERSVTSSCGITEIRRSRASAMATSVTNVGFFCCWENSLRTAAAGMFARAATSALDKPSS